MKRQFKAPTKWVLAGTLFASTLGCYQAFKRPVFMGSAVFASSSKTIEIIGDDGEAYEVNLSQAGDDKTAAMFPSQLQGQACEAESCLNKITLGVSIDQDLKDLEKAFRKELAKAKKSDVKEKASETESKEENSDDDVVRLKKHKKSKKEIEESEDDLDDAEIDQELADEEARSKKVEKEFNRLERRCEIKSEKDDQTKCLTRGLVDLLKKKDLKVSKADARKFFEDHISADITEFTKSQNDKFGYIDAATLLKTIEGNVPKEHDDLRKLALLASLQGVKEFNQQRLADQTYAQKAGDMALLQSTFDQQNWMINSLIPTLRQESAGGLSQAIGSKFIDQASARKLMSAYDANLSSLMTNGQLVSRGDNALIVIDANSLDTSLLLDRQVQQLVPQAQGSSIRSMIPIDGSGRMGRSSLLPGQVDQGFAGRQGMIAQPQMMGNQMMMPDSTFDQGGVRAGTVQFGTVRRVSPNMIRSIGQ